MDKSKPRTKRLQKQCAKSIISSYICSNTAKKLMFDSSNDQKKHACPFTITYTKFKNMVNEKKKKILDKLSIANISYQDSSLSPAQIPTQNLDIGATKGMVKNSSQLVAVFDPKYTISGYKPTKKSNKLKLNDPELVVTKRVHKPMSSKPSMSNLNRTIATNISSEVYSAMPTS